eukprot:m.27947 g.27947  ORF g.27947 m.27947 type:complete len:102 (+) comp7956_c0_seq2:1225-1530(+)
MPMQAYHQIRILEQQATTTTILIIFLLHQLCEQEELQARGPPTLPPGHPLPLPYAEERGKDLIIIIIKVIITYGKCEKGHGIGVSLDLFFMQFNVYSLHDI